MYGSRPHRDGWRDILGAEGALERASARPRKLHVLSVWDQSSVRSHSRALRFGGEHLDITSNGQRGAAGRRARGGVDRGARRFRRLTMDKEDSHVVDFERNGDGEEQHRKVKPLVLIVDRLKALAD